ncbi:cytochrome O ubiquinol oxidase [Defluviimonas sp. 20V17]|uniref:Cytochrome o ubiquinol oxidase subunit 1 n=1 Tax=Allgaiera indica TaxID=765699 RepID=A0AAN4UVD3_9RHOB|nr:cbb3-type cytochrome c oxidase subunit I [Allgaiera indica]KDB04212.1 cytochrome O ubiquinol oxidase [Defluviimonas sp. 20V17]GHE06470.1 cytochrome ubiquinol oxidase subunit I [Allgaiera indica]SDX93878.1 cytochrome o ubiquinol oxidase subunit 1 [Allgaiera indica]
MWHALRLFLFGRLGLDNMPFDEILKAHDTTDLISGCIGTFAAALAVGGALVTLWLMTRYRLWGKFWSNWATSVDHKKIGIMYIALAWIMMLRALIEAAIMRGQQVAGYGGGGMLSGDHFGQLFSTHGTIMIFFMAMPFLTGLINFVVPMQIGARDVSFPTLNSVSLGLTVAGALLIMVSLVLQPFSTGGWSGYPPFTEARYNPGPGPDYWIWAVTLSSLGSTFTGMNFAVTIYKERAPGMKLMRMPLFTWTALCTAILMIFAMPPLTVATALLALDRYAGFHFFTNTAGGDMMNYANLFWLFGHPEVYILILPSFGVYSEVFSTFSGKTLYGYSSLVIATMCIAVLSFTVWVHHFFTMGQGADLNAAFGIATMLIGVPTGVKIYDWMLTMFRGRVRMTVPIVYGVGFLFLFCVGGMSGILLANPSIDYQVHNTLFLVAHFHNMLIPGLLFGLIAGYTMWFPKAFGFRLDDRWGYRAAWGWIIGFMMAFFPLYVLGLMGMPRRTVSFLEPAYLPWTIIALLGAFVVLFALFSLFMQLWVSIKNREALAVPVGDPWDGRSLEWSMSAPPPEYNFPVIPEVKGRDAFMTLKEAGDDLGEPEGGFKDITMPANSALGPFLCVTGTATAFGLVWYIWWLALLGAAASFLAVVLRGFARNTERTIPAAEVRRSWERWRDRAMSAPRVPRADELTDANRGHAVPAKQEIVA